MTDFNHIRNAQLKTGDFIETAYARVCRLVSKLWMGIGFNSSNVEFSYANLKLKYMPCC